MNQTSERHDAKVALVGLLLIGALFFFGSNVSFASSSDEPQNSPLFKHIGDLSSNGMTREVWKLGERHPTAPRSLSKALVTQGTCTTLQTCTAGSECTSEVGCTGGECTNHVNCTGVSLCTQNEGCTKGQDCTAANPQCTQGDNCTNGPNCTRQYHKACTWGPSCTTGNCTTARGPSCTQGVVYCQYLTQGSGCDWPLPVQLSSFAALAGDGEITLKWTTESEVNNLGFYLYRSEQIESEYLRLSQLIQGAGNSTSRNDYEFIDRAVTNGITYYYKLYSVSMNGYQEEIGFVFAIPTSVHILREENSNFPTEYCLFQNYPNPFNQGTSIKFAIPKDSKGQIKAVLINLSIFNLLGERVITLIDGNIAPGVYTIQWDGRDESGQFVPSGIYIYSLRSQKYFSSLKMLLAK